VTEIESREPENRRAALVRLRQRLSITNFLAIAVSFPYVLILSFLMPVPLALGIAFAPAWFLLLGNSALIEGAMTESARTDVRRGVIASKVLLAMAPFALLIALLLPGIGGRTFLVLATLAAVPALVLFLLKARKFCATT
jgi:hypothetical protein